MRAVIGTTLLESASDVWKILTATGVVSDRMSGYWDERVFFPLAEGSYMLPSAIVISVWVDVAKASTSRSKVSYSHVCFIRMPRPRACDEC